MPQAVPRLPVYREPRGMRAQSMSQADPPLNDFSARCAPLLAAAFVLRIRTNNP